MSKSKSEMRCPAASLAWRQYPVKLASGRAANLGFTLADPNDETMARLKEAHHASHLGLLVVLDEPVWVEDVVLWLQQATFITLVARNRDTIVGEELRGLLPRYFAVFFDEIKDIAPDLASISFAAVPRTGDKNLH